MEEKDKVVEETINEEIVTPQPEDVENTNIESVQQSQDTTENVPENEPVVEEKDNTAIVVTTDEVKNPTPKKEDLSEDNNNFSTSNVIKEMFAFKNLKKLQLAAAILWGIALAPFLILALGLMVFYYVSLFIFKMISNPADYLITKLKTDSTKTATQVVTFLVGYPIVFLSRIITAVLSINFFILHFLITINCYVYSFGGITFHPFLFDPGYKPYKTNTEKFSVGPNIAAYIISIVILLTILMLIIIPPIIYAIDSPSYDSGSSGSGSSSSSSYIYASNTSSYDPYSLTTTKTYTVKGCDDAYYCFLEVNSYSIDYVKFEGNNGNYYVYKNNVYNFYEPSSYNVSLSVDYGDILVIVFNDYDYSSSSYTSYTMDIRCS